MTGSQIDVLLKTMALVGTLLLIGTFLRAKVSLFQNLFLPACVRRDYRTDFRAENAGSVADFRRDHDNCL